MSPFLDLPHEIRQNILGGVEAKDLAALSLCCRELRTFIPGNRLLWKEIYLNHFDKPPAVPGLKREESDWEHDVHELMLMRKILSGDDKDVKKANFKMVGKQVSNLIRDASASPDSFNIDLLNELFSSQANRESFFCQSSLFQRIRDASGSQKWPSFEDRQLSAKLHCLYGVPITHLGHITRQTRTYPFACSKVYDLRNYTQNTMWGPFMEDGSGDVDWERVEAILVVLAHNLNIFKHRTNGQHNIGWNETFIDSVANSYKSKTGLRPAALETPLDLRDPYNITGTYMRIVTFLDFTELFAYNFAFGQPAAGEPRQPLDTTEAIRLITMEIKVTKIEPPGPDDGQALPVVHFEGTSKSMHSNWDPNANSGIRGSVRLTKEGEIRWTSFSIYQGEERWRSEGIQLGGLSSARGVIGNWFDKDFDLHGPAGPTAYWKISDELPTHGSESDDDDFVPDGADAAEGNGFEDEGDEEEDGSSDEEGEGVTHQALLDMITHIHAHHHGNANGIEGLVNEEGVFTGLNGMGFQVIVEETTEEVEGDNGEVNVVLHTHQTHEHEHTDDNQDMNSREQEGDGGGPSPSA